MKTITLCATILLILAAGLSAQVKTPVPFSLYAGGGGAFPLEPDTTFSDIAKPGYHLMAGIGYKFMPLLEGILKAEYYRFENDFDGDGATGSWDFTLIGASVRGGIGVPGQRIRPYVTGGVGLAINEREEGRQDSVVVFAAQKQATDVYFDVGAGMEWSLGQNVHMFVEGRYIYISTANEPTSFIPVSLGFRIF